MFGELYSVNENKRFFLGLFYKNKINKTDRTILVVPLHYLCWHCKKSPASFVCIQHFLQVLFGHLARQFQLRSDGVFVNTRSLTTTTVDNNHHHPRTARPALILSLGPVDLLDLLGAEPQHPPFEAAHGGGAGAGTEHRGRLRLLLLLLLLVPVPETKQNGGGVRIHPGLTWRRNQGPRGLT